MLVHAKRKELLIAASQAAKAAPRKTSVEELKGIHLEANPNSAMLTLTATNNEIAIRSSICAVVEEAGSAVINAKLLPEILSRLPDEEVDLELDAHSRLTIRSGAASYALQVLPGEKYPMPDLPFPDDTVSVSGLCTLAQNTLFAVAEGDSNPLLQCVRLTLDAGGLKAVSTNGFCIVEAEGDKSCKGQTEFLLPAYSLKTLAAISLDSDIYEMGITGKSVVFWNGTLLFSARLMEGKFPNTSGIMGLFQGKYSAHVDVQELCRAVDTVASLIDDWNRTHGSSRIELSFGEHELIVSSETAQGRASAPVKALVLNAPEKPFYYNYEKLLEYLSIAKGKVTLEFDEKGLLVIRPGATRYMQSPMRPPRKEEQVQNAA